MSARERSQWLVWWWPTGTGEHDGDVPVPYEHRCDGLEVALRFAVDLARPGVDWLKVFPAGSEHAVQARWNPADGWSELATLAAREICTGRGDG